MIQSNLSHSAYILTIYSPVLVPEVVLEVIEYSVFHVQENLVSFSIVLLHCLFFSKSLKDQLIVFLNFLMLLLTTLVSY
jgi:hypothetical protein